MNTPPYPNSDLIARRANSPYRKRLLAERLFERMIDRQTTPNNSPPNTLYLAATAVKAAYEFEEAWETYKGDPPR